MQAKQLQKCGECGGTGHNRRTCGKQAPPKSNVVALRDVSRAVPTRHAAPIGSPPPTAFRASLKELKPQSLASIENSLRTGRLKDWADLADTMLKTDPYLAGVYETRIVGVASAGYEVVPADDSTQAELAAELVRHAMDRMPSWTGFLSHLLHANGIGLAVSEHSWERGTAPEAFNTPMSAVYSSPSPIMTRDIEYLSDWSIQVKSYTETGNYEWVRIPINGAERKDGDADPSNFVVHTGHRPGQPPTFAGDLLTVAHYWLFKHWAEIYFALANERSGTPVPYAMLDQSATDEAFDETLENLAGLTGGFAAAFRNGVTEVAFLESANGDSFGQTQRDVIDRYNREYKVGILGSVDNVEADGGSQARAVSQRGVTIVPRHYVDADELRSTLTRQYIKPLLRYNLALFGGVMPPMPELDIKLVSEEPPAIDVELLAAGMPVTVNEARASVGLEPRENDGETLLTAPAVAAPPPFPERQMALPMTTSQATLSASAIRDARLRYGSSVTRGSS